VLGEVRVKPIGKRLLPCDYSRLQPEGYILLVIRHQSSYQTAGCLTTTLVYHAAVRGIKIDALESELEGDLDIRGFLGLSNTVRSGFENILVNFRVKTDAEKPEKL
jgi:OsmC-like protein